MNSSGDHAAISRSKPTTRIASTPAPSSSRARVGSRSGWAGLLGPQDRHRVRVERHGHDRVDAEARGAGPCLAEHVGVPEVHAVEVADAHHGAAEVGRHVVDVSPDLHGPSLVAAAGGPVAQAGATGTSVLRGVPQRTSIPRYMPMNACGMPPIEASGQKQVRT